MIDLSKLNCACDDPHFTAGDYRLATLLGCTVEEAHNLGDEWENVLDGVIDDTPRIPLGGDKSFWDDFIEQEKVKYERALKARTDQEGS